MSSFSLVLGWLHVWPKNTTVILQNRRPSGKNHYLGRLFGSLQLCSALWVLLYWTGNFFFCPLSQPLAKVIQFHQAFLDLHALSAHLFFLPLCQICFDKRPWQNEYSISPCFSFDWHNLFCFLLVLVLQLVLDEYNKSQLWSTPANMYLTTCSKFWLHHDLSAVSQPLSL